jgi:hypothetical protein
VVGVVAFFDIGQTIGINLVIGQRPIFHVGQTPINSFLFQFGDFLAMNEKVVGFNQGAMTIININRNDSSTICMRITGIGIQFHDELWRGNAAKQKKI